MKIALFDRACNLAASRDQCCDDLVSGKSDMGFMGRAYLATCVWKGLLLILIHWLVDRHGLCHLSGNEGDTKSHQRMVPWCQAQEKDMDREACCRRQTVEITGSLQIQQMTISHVWRDDLEPRKVILYMLRLITSAVTEDISRCLAME